MMNYLKIQLKKWSLRTSNHGLPKIVGAENKVLVLLWIIIFLLMVFYCVGNIYGDISLYFLYKTKTNINIAREISSELPTVSICNHEGKQTYPNISLVSCRIKQNRYFEEEDCDLLNKSNDIIFNANPNGCLMFNQRLKVADGGADIGVKLTFKKNKAIDDDVDDTIIIIDEMNRTNLKPQYHRHNWNLFRCKMKTLINYEIKNRIMKQSLSYPYSNCIEQWSLIDKFIYENISTEMNLERSSYNEETCFLKCLDLFGYQFEGCSEKCPPKCLTNTYTIRDSMICIDSGETTETVGIVNIKYIDLYYIKYDSLPSMTDRQLMGLIGGRLALFLGMSALSIIDFVEFFALLFILLQKKQVNQAVVNPPSAVNERLRENVKQRIVQWCLNSNIHGVGSLVRAKTYVTKTIWLLGILTCLIYCLTILERNMEIYLKFNVSSNYKPERNLFTPFPAFTFVTNENLFDNNVFINKMCVDGIMENRTFSPDEILLKEFENNTAINPDFNKFYTINMIENPTLVSASLDGNSAYCVFEFNLTITSFIHFLLHNQSVAPIYGRFFNISKGEEVIIGLRIQSGRVLPSPYSNCIHDWKSLPSREIYEFYSKYRSFKHFDYVYDTYTCIDMCQEYYMSLSCNSTFENHVYENMDKYNTDCYLKNSNYIENLHKCLRICPQNCNYMLYEVRTTLNSNNKDKVSVAVYFDDTDQNMIVDEPKLSQNELIASIGGQFGLCIGISLLSAIDLFILIIYIGKMLWRKQF